MKAKHFTNKLSYTSNGWQSGPVFRLLPRPMANTANGLRRCPPTPHPPLHLAAQYALSSGQRDGGLADPRLRCGWGLLL
uniref:Uncharacterized protein n=1 Tax=Knipowitschia caucasica TaxID=637954 RepID=A0AAV2LRE5_KNICA